MGVYKLNGYWAEPLKNPGYTNTNNLLICAEAAAPLLLVKLLLVLSWGQPRAAASCVCHNQQEVDRLRYTQTSWTCFRSQLSKTDVWGFGVCIPSDSSCPEAFSPFEEHVKSDNMASGCWPALPVPGAQVIPTATGETLGIPCLRIQTKGETRHSVGFGLDSS